MFSLLRLLWLELLRCYALLVVAAFIEAKKPKDAPVGAGSVLFRRLWSMLLFKAGSYCTIIREVSLSFKALCSASWTAVSILCRRAIVPSVAGAARTRPHIGQCKGTPPLEC